MRDALHSSFTHLYHIMHRTTFLPLIQLHSLAYVCEAYSSILLILNSSVLVDRKSKKSKHCSMLLLALYIFLRLFYSWSRRATSLCDVYKTNKNIIQFHECMFSVNVSFAVCVAYCLRLSSGFYNDMVHVVWFLYRSPIPNECDPLSKFILHTSRHSGNIYIHTKYDSRSAQHSKHNTLCMFM